MASAICAASAFAASNTGIADISVYPAPGTTVTEITEIRVVSGFINSRPVAPAITFNGVTHAVTAAYPDYETVVFTLNEPVDKSGEYQIVIPENAFGMGWGDENSPEIAYSLTVDNPNGGGGENPGDIVNQVPSGFTFSPAAGSEVAVLSSFSVTTTTDHFLSAGPNPTITINGSLVNTVNAGSGALEETVTFTLAEPITEPGHYTIYIPQGELIYTTDMTDVPSIMVTVIVTGGEAPLPDYTEQPVTTSPESGSTLKEIGEILVQYPKLTSVYLGPQYDKVTVMKDGTPVEAEYTLLPDEDDFNEAHVMHLSFTPALTADGLYTISFPAQAFKVSKYPVMKYSAPFEISLNVDSTIVGAEITEADSAEAEYFSLQGLRVKNPRRGDVVIERRGSEVRKITVR